MPTGLEYLLYQFLLSLINPKTMKMQYHRSNLRKEPNGTGSQKKGNADTRNSEPESICATMTLLSLPKSAAVTPCEGPLLLARLARAANPVSRNIMAPASSA